MSSSRVACSYAVLMGAPLSVGGRRPVTAARPRRVDVDLQARALRMKFTRSHISPSSETLHLERRHRQSGPVAEAAKDEPVGRPVQPDVGLGQIGRVGHGPRSAPCHPCRGSRRMPRKPYARRPRSIDAVVWGTGFWRARAASSVSSPASASTCVGEGRAAANPTAVAQHASTASTLIATTAPPAGETRMASTEAV